MFKRLGLLLTGVMLASVACADDVAAPAAPAAWEAGKSYFVIDPPQPTSSGDKIEVLEVFSYACPHCAHFQPYAEQIKQALPAYASFSYMPQTAPASAASSAQRWQRPRDRPKARG